MLNHVQPGFSRPAAVLTFRLTIPNAEIPDAQRAVRMEQQILGNMAALPGVSSVGVGTGVPLDGSYSINPIYQQDRTYAEGQMAPLRNFRFVTPGYFKALGGPFVAGHDYTWTDILDMRPVVLISEKMARECWGSPAAALGKPIRTSPKDEWAEVIGVTKDVHDDGLNRGAPASVRWPFLMRHFFDEQPMLRRHLTLAVRSPRVGTDGFLQEIRQAIWSVNPNLPLHRAAGAAGHVASQAADLRWRYPRCRKVGEHLRAGHRNHPQGEGQQTNRSSASWSRFRKPKIRSSPTMRYTRNGPATRSW